MSLALAAWHLWPKQPPSHDELRTVYHQLSQRVGDLWDSGQLRRPDGYTYAVDIGQLLIHAVQSDQKALYLSIRDAAIPHLIRDDQKDPYTQGFVGWRYQPGMALDASGTTEALRIAAGLWMGAQRFHLKDDGALAMMIIDGYGRHAYIDQGTWLIRNYFNFHTRSFANDSFLVDYDPDFLTDMAAHVGDAKIEALAERSYGLIESAFAPVGLFHTLVQPDVKTIMPDAPIMVFSPNDVIQINNACAVAATIAKGRPSMANALVNFAYAEGMGLRRAYYGRDGQPVDSTPADSTAWSCLVRVAALLERPTARDRFLLAAFPHWQWLADAKEPRPFALIEALLALDSLLAPSR